MTRDDHTTRTARLGILPRTLPGLLLTLLAVLEGNREVIWRAETNSPSILRRRGWSADSLHVGEKITVEGWPARDGSKYLRLRSATRQNGEPVGTAPTPRGEK